MRVCHGVVYGVCEWVGAGVGVYVCRPRLSMSV